MIAHKPSASAHEVYAFGDFRLDLHSRALSRGAQLVRSAPKTFDMILYLVENAGRVVKKDELAEHVWPGLQVADDNISQHVFLARKALDDLARPHRYILTAHGEGYRFIGAVKSSSGYIKAALHQDFGELERYTAQHLYRNGRHFLNFRTEAGNRSAIDMFTRAAETDPAFSEAHAAIAEAYWFAAHSYYMDSRDAMNLALHHVNVASRIDANCADALIVRAAIEFFYGYDSRAALEHLSRAASLGSVSLHVPILQIHITSGRGEHERAVFLALDALRRYPASAEISLQLGIAMYFARDFETAARHLAGLLALDPALAPARYYLGLCYLLMGEGEAARQELTRAMQPELGAVSRVVWPVQRPAAGALALLESRQGESSRIRGINFPAFARAIATAAPEHRAECVSALTEAVAKRDPWVALLPSDPIFDSLRGEAAFDAVVQTAMLPRSLATPQAQET